MPRVLYLLVEPVIPVRKAESELHCLFECSKPEVLFRSLHMEHIQWLRDAPTCSQRYIYNTSSAIEVPMLSGHHSQHQMSLLCFIRLIFCHICSQLSVFLVSLANTGDLNLML